MVSPNWYQIQQIAAARSLESRYTWKPSSSNRGRVFAIGIPIVLLLFVGAFISVAPLSAAGSHGASSQPLVRQPFTGSASPTVVITPSAVSQLSTGSTFTVQVQVLNMAPFNGWDIQIYTNLASINATGLSITGNDFQVNASTGTPFEIVHCVNGVGTGCTSSDGVGYVHSAYGNTATLSGNGLLFTITYKVVGNFYSPLSLINDKVSSPSSGNGDAHSSISGVYAFAIVFGAGGGVGGGRDENL